ncbi:hypothetical protein [uncultured Thiocystis sp.]|jgi:hypothetical protein|uniref:hypothetical protein n=1 Tax=uncultured Thiocystis sp. TaxID=1202134 RepID=UPI0025EDA993|nr:hypothetical protein [uncultured Thiocystis sp.]
MTSNVNLLVLVLGILIPAGLTLADDLRGIPQDISARMYRMQAQQNRTIGRHAGGTAGDVEATTDAGYDGVTAGSGDLGAGETGNLVIGDFSHADNKGLREVNILVNGDIINWNNSR